MDMIIHASTVCLDGGAVMLRGPSGAGKSALALDLIGRGGTLVADDRTMLTLSDGAVCAACPAAIAGLIEARGIGILRLPHVSEVPVRLVVDLVKDHGARLPEQEKVTLLGQKIPLLHSPWTAQLAPAIVLMMRGAERIE